MKYGTEVVRDWGVGPQPRDGIGRVDLSASGNVILEVGQESAVGGSWEKVGHVVLTPTEWNRLSVEVAQLQRAQAIEVAR